MPNLRLDQPPTCKELAKTNLAVFVDVKNRNDPLDQRILWQLGHIEYFSWIQVATAIRVDLFEACVQFLDFLLSEMARKFSRVNVTHCDYNAYTQLWKFWSSEWSLHVA